MTSINHAAMMKSQPELEGLLASSKICRGCHLPFDPFQGSPTTGVLSKDLSNANPEESIGLKAKSWEKNDIFPNNHLGCTKLCK